LREENRRDRASPFRFVAPAVPDCLMTPPAAPNTKALILAAGVGTRLQPLTHLVPKCLVPIHGRPLLDYWFDLIEPTPVRQVRINTHHLREQVVAYITAKNRQDRFELTEAYEPELLGSSGTVTAARSWMDDADDCLIIYADNLSTMDLSAFIAFHQQHDDPFSIALYRSPNPSACGIAELDEEQRVVAFEEKPAAPRSNLANAGVYLVTQAAFREIADQQAFDLAFEVLPQFVGRMRGWELDGYHRDIGSHEALQAAHEETAHLFEARAALSEESP